jgi:hypothetical protein
MTNTDLSTKVATGCSHMQPTPTVLGHEADNLNAGGER